MIRTKAVAHLPILAAGAALCGCVSEPPPIKTTRLVLFYDQDFATGRDVAALRWRVELAATAACMAPSDGLIDLDCKAAALRDAREQIERVLAERDARKQHKLAATDELNSKGVEK